MTESCLALKFFSYDQIFDANLVYKLRRMSRCYDLSGVQAEFVLTLPQNLDERLEHVRMKMILWLFDTIERSSEFLRSED